MQNIRSDIGSMTETEFLYDGKTLRAVTKSITDIGEAAHQMMDDFPNVETTNPDIWLHLKMVYAMRIKLTHSYFSICLLYTSFCCFSFSYPKLLGLYIRLQLVILLLFVLIPHHSLGLYIKLQLVILLL